MMNILLYGFVKNNIIFYLIKGYKINIQYNKFI